MSKWIVSNSPSFDDDKKRLLGGFQASLFAILRQGLSQKAAAFERAFLKFHVFLNRADALEQGEIGPEEDLAFVAYNVDGVPLYSMIRNDWRCIYRVEDGKCTAIQIDRMFPNWRNAEEARHEYGQKLPRL